VLTQNSLILPVQGGELVLGTWQGLYLWEHRQAPHERRIIVTVWTNINHACGDFSRVFGRTAAEERAIWPRPTGSYGSRLHQGHSRLQQVGSDAYADEH